jgi:prepilin-type N-terminal cleavage/methylation domain-containing protein
VSRRGFTLIEITVALIVGGMALSAAAALLTGLSDRADEIRTAGIRVDRDGNGERMLRNLLGNLRFSTDSMHTLSGDSLAVTFLTWCETAEGWLRPCRAHLAVEPRGRFQVSLALTDGETRTVAFSQVDRTSATIRYLRDPVGGGRWMTQWTDIVVPGALQLIAGTDTLMVPVW